MRGQMNMANELKLCSPILSTFEVSVKCDMQLRVGVEENRALSVDHCWLQVLQFLVHLIDLLSTLLGYDFARIQKAVVTEMGPPNNDHDLFLVQVWLWEVLWSFFSVQPLSWSSPVVV